ncbi:hypothetical protein R1flu_019860 [Riccia fluitans]|uniref:Uncharacterized protein n=1 Tax=Riccia fluitans TaxID=41844 RepID=A0ABD1ZKA0_9MARC
MSAVSVASSKSKAGLGKVRSVGKEVADVFEMSKENILNGSRFSEFERQSGRDSAEGVRGKGRAPRAALHPRNRSSTGSRLSAPPPLTTNRRELSPPVLTTSDNFKPAKRVGASKPALPPMKPSVPPSGGKIASGSIHSDAPSSDSTPPELGASTSKSRLATRKASLPGRRLSVVRLSISKEKRQSVSPREKVKEPTRLPVFSTRKVELQTTPNIEKDKRSRLIEKKVPSPSSPSKARSNVVKPEAVDKDDSSTKPRIVTRPSGNSKSTVQNSRARSLAIVTESEQRLQEQNQQLELKLRQLQEELLQRDHEIERLKSAGMVLNNLAKNHSDEVRDLKLRLKETFNQNAEVRDLCEKLEKEHRKEVAARKKAEENENNTNPHETQLASHVVRFETMGIDPPQKFPKADKARRTEEDQAGDDDNVEVDESMFEVHNEIEEHSFSKLNADDPESEVPAGGDTSRRWIDATDEVTEEGPVISNHQDVHYALQDLQEIISQEESSLRNRCADAVKALDMSLSPLLTPQGVLDVDSLKALIASVSSRGTEFSTHRFNSIFRF